MDDIKRFIIEHKTGLVVGVLVGMFIRSILR